MFPTRRQDARVGLQAKAALEQLFGGLSATSSTTNSNSSPDQNHKTRKRRILSTTSISIKPDRLQHLRSENLRHFAKSLGSNHSVAKFLRISQTLLESLLEGKEKLTREMAIEFEQIAGLPSGWFQNITEPIVPSAVIEKFRNTKIGDVAMKTDDELIREKLNKIISVFPNARNFLCKKGVDPTTISAVLAEKRVATKRFAEKIEQALNVRTGWMLNEETSDQIKTTLISTIGVQELEAPKAVRGPRPKQRATQETQNPEVAAKTVGPAPTPAVVEKIQIDERPAKKNQTIGAYLLEMIEQKIKSGNLSNLQIGRVLVALES